MSSLNKIEAKTSFLSVHVPDADGEHQHEQNVHSDVHAGEVRVEGVHVQRHRHRALLQVGQILCELYCPKLKGLLDF